MRSGHVRVFERITRGVIRQIVSGQIVAGERLPAEREMAGRCGTSRVTIREAYRALEQQGLVTIRRGAGGGAFVSAPPPEVLVDALALTMRLHRTSAAEVKDARAIERTVARLAARHARPRDLARLKAALVAEERAELRGRPLQPFTIRFHRALADCAHNLPLTLLAHALATLMIERPEALDICAWHRAVVQAVARHDEEGAARLIAQGPAIAADPFRASAQACIA